MIVEKPHELIRVVADFNGTKVRPLAFTRKTGRQYDIASVNLVYRRRVGDRQAWCFACSDAANTYVLSYDPDSLQWILEEVQMEG
ncbi:MAG: hypothetical protein WCT27_05660 [Patescibacteria group bacterium]|jgi:hypothetical protein